MLSSLGVLSVLLLFNPAHGFSGETGSCPAAGPVHVKAPKKNIWNQLTKSESEDVTRYLLGLKDYNFTIANNITTLYDNYINEVDLWKPSKESALQYLDRHGPLPERWARTTVVVGSADPPYVENWLVGPLPVGPKTAHRPADEYYTRNRLSWHAKTVSELEASFLGQYMNQTMTGLNDVFTDLFGGSWSSGYLSFGADGGVTPFGWPSYNGSVRQTWSWLQIQSAPDTAWYLYPLPFYMLNDFSGQDPSKWHTVEIVYDDVVYPTVDDFKAAWKAGKLRKFQMQTPSDSEWALRTPQGKERKFDDVPGPMQVQFDGPRYSVNEEEKYVDYQGWTFYLSYDWSTGLRIFDIRFKGERIIYELGAEDALANYAGKDPANQATAYLDRFYGIGSSGVPLAKGYDCPYNAIFLNASYPYGGDWINTPQGICIFEHDMGFPASRHTAATSASVTKLFALNVRYVATIGNYDYLFNYIFYPEGTVEVQVMASGYIQATYWGGVGGEEAYGTRLGPNVMGALHDHVIPYKVDFDIAGTNNSFVVDKVELEEREFPWTHGQKVRQKRIVSSILQTEDEGRMNFGSNGLEHWKVVNKDAKNKWGHERGYRIQPGLASIHITDPTDPKQGDNAHWADYNLNVLRYHDTERSCTGNLNQNLPTAPQVDFSKFFNSESLVQEDLVVYFNLGMHHVPRSEDLPTTIFVGARSSMMLSPFNWRDGDESRDLKQAFYAVPATNGERKWVVNDYGIRPQGNKQCLVPTTRPLDLGMVDTVAKKVAVPFGQLGMGGAAGPRR